jgi:hypothetical protein
MNCSLKRHKVKTTEDWILEHLHHLAVVDKKEFDTKPFDGPYENWHWLICSCGAEHLCIKKEN